MTIQALQEFIGRHMASAGALTALAAALDARASGAPLDPAVGARVQELLETLGGGGLLDEVGVQEATIMRSLIRAMHLLDGKLLFAETRAIGWSHAEPEILTSIGETARMHALSATREIIPACAGLAERMRAPGAAMLDVGVGVAGTAIAMAQMWPELAIVGIDVWQPSLRLARENVERAGVSARISLREQSVEALADRDAYDYVYYANAFIPERVAIAGLERAHAALRPGGWVSIAVSNDTAPAPIAALFRLRETQWGGPAWNPPQGEQVLRDAGYVDVHALPTTPTAIVRWVVGRCA
ncbi:MAG TPA: class I SAM-dependent methyltransferase [Nannocystaceae bacterium]|nr:class I SAM-dependent methyltransferase [Nannocystaceae bacterium]